MKEHPRVRGENKIIAHHRSRYGGTSPRARGKRWVVGCVLLIAGTSPRARGKLKRDGDENLP